MRGFSTVFEEGYIFTAVRELATPWAQLYNPSTQHRVCLFKCGRNRNAYLPSLSFSRRKGYCWVVLSAPGLLLGVESGQRTNCPKKKNCGESRLHFPESLCGSINGGLGLEGGLEREWRSHVEVRGKRGWERKEQIVSHGATSVCGRHCAGGCRGECYSGQRGMGRFVERQLLPVWNQCQQREGCQEVLLDVRNTIPTPSSLVFCKRQNSIGLV